METLIIVVTIVGAVLLFLTAVAAIGYRIWAASRLLARLNDQTATITEVAGERVVRIPVLRISPVKMSVPWLGFVKSTGVNEFLIAPYGIEYRILRRKRLPFDRVSLVDLPSSSTPAYFVLGIGASRGIGVQTTSSEAAYAALIELASHCRLSPRAQQWIGASPRPPMDGAPTGAAPEPG